MGDKTFEHTDVEAAPPFTHIAVVGLGLIGASFAGAVRKAWPSVEILGIDIDERTREKAVSDGIATRTAAPEDDAFVSYLGDACDLVMLATPVDVDEPYFKTIAESGYQGVVTDTASTKSRITQMASGLLRYPEHYVPGHPMAGSEVKGIEGARPDLFQGAYWIICPDESTPPEHIVKLHELITGIDARAIMLPREEHDKAMAIVSHVPHMVASSLMALASRAADEQKTLLHLAAGGFKDTTRIAAGSPQLWCGIAFDNAAEISARLKDMEDILDAYRNAIDTGDRKALTELLAEAAEARRELPAAWVPSTERLLEVRIPMANHPGVVAEVTTIASVAGCNIQSIEIDHVTEATAFLSLILTDEGDVGKLSTELINHGYSVSFSPLEPKEHIHV